MSHYDTLIENLVIKYLFNQLKNPNQYNIAVARVICEKLLSHLKKAIDNMVCPYCGRKFHTKASIKAHLIRTSTKLVVKGGSRLRHVYSIPTNPCASNFLMEVKYAVSLYREFKEEIMTSKKRVTPNPLRVGSRKQIVAYKSFPIWLEMKGILR